MNFISRWLSKVSKFSFKVNLDSEIIEKAKILELFDEQETRSSIDHLDSLGKEGKLNIE